MNVFAAWWLEIELMGAYRAVVDENIITSVKHYPDNLH